MGRLWTLLTGERGEYELARGDRIAARQDLDAMMRFANDGMMIPEQIWDRSESPRAEFSFGSGTGSATPLAWSMAQFSVREDREAQAPDNVTSSNSSSSSESDLIFVADLGGTHLRAATVDRNGRIHHRLKQPTPQAELPAEIVQALVEAAHECEPITRAKGRFPRFQWLCREPSTLKKAW